MLWRALLICFQLAIAICGWGQNAYVNREEAVVVGNIRQWIQLRGDTTSPVLLFLHGGPGNSVMAYADRFTDQLQQHFLVVQWDQRGAGQTAQMNPTTETPTVNLMVNDAVEMVSLLKERFHHEKIFLAGHSWGGFLALMVAGKVPHLLHACIPISPMVNQSESESLALEWMKDEARKLQRTDATKELAQIRIPFETAQDLYLHRKWLALLGGRPAPKRAFVFGWSKQWLPLFSEASSFNLFSALPALKCPVWVFTGTNDFQCHFQLTRQYAEQLVAPSKELVLQEGAGHSIPSSHGEWWQEHVLRLVHKLMP